MYISYKVKNITVNHYFNFDIAKMLKKWLYISLNNSFIY